MMSISPRWVAFLILPLFLFTACSAASPAYNGINVAATTTLVGDVVQQVGGEWIHLTVILPAGTDPHTFEPRPKDMAALSDASLVFINGLGLEEGLKPALDANVKGTLVEVSAGIAVLLFDEHTNPSEAVDHAAGDPHTWMDPNNVIIWVQNITAALSQADPAHKEQYSANAQAYTNELKALDSWIRQEVTQIPPERRILVTDHAVLGYFAKRYGFEQIGAVVASLSSNASPSAQELALLEDSIRTHNVDAIFVSTTVNPNLSEQVAQDSGIKITFLYTGSLTAPGGEADTYLQFMRYNTQAIVDTLK
jgi:ABC-type Zn uptake system ZnuABC Zn-binding protein ZnuA